MVPMIRYEGVTKIFGSGSNAVTAVNDITFDIRKGDLVTFLGPSGCGKTTLLRLTNRLVPLTRGSITVNGRDISSVDPVKLRQSMGYAIQAVGLFPNKSVYGNIATVPHLLGWGKKRIGDRVDELLYMLRLDPEDFRHRYPVELSGGQQQRIGVARCLAADPEILLMDEPFGAIDPINRVEIQDEFLRVQSKLKKTIAFVTHDIHEAIKMGDKIAIFQEGKLVQYDRPETILTRPKNQYIADFVGADRALKVLGILTARTAANSDPENTLRASMSSQEALTKLAEKDLTEGTVVDGTKPIGYVNTALLERKAGKIERLAKPYPTVMRSDEKLKDVISHMLMHDMHTFCVVDDKGDFAGTISFGNIRDAILKIYSEKAPNYV